MGVEKREASSSARRVKMVAGDMEWRSVSSDGNMNVFHRRCDVSGVIS